MPEYGLKCPFARAALTVLVLCRYSISPEESLEMLNMLSGPSPLTPADEEELCRKLKGREYIPFSFFKDATPENEYEPSLPFIICVRDTTFSYEKQGYVTLYVQSSGTEIPRSIQLRKKESTGEWFLWEHGLVDPIREPQNLGPYK